MAGIVGYDCEGTITIGSILLNRPAFAVLGDESGNGGLYQLLTTAEQRGTDRILPTVGGVIPYRRRVTVTVHQLRILVAGDILANGSAPAGGNAKVGLATNLKYLYDSIVTPTGTSDGTRSVTCSIPPYTGTGSLHVTSLTQTRYGLGRNKSMWEGLLTVSVPAGRITWA